MNEQNNINNAVVLRNAEIQPKTADASAELLQDVDSELSMIHPLQLVSPISPRYLAGFRSFYQMMPNYKILQTSLQNLTWSHVLKVLRVDDSTAPIGQTLVAQLKKIFASILNINRSPLANDLQEIDFEPSIDFAPILSINRSPMANDLQSVFFSAHPLHLFLSWMCDYELSFTKRIA